MNNKFCYQKMSGVRCEHLVSERVPHPEPSMALRVYKCSKTGIEQGEEYGPVELEPLHLVTSLDAKRCPELLA